MLKLNYQRNKGSPFLFGLTFLTITGYDFGPVYTRSLRRHLLLLMSNGYYQMLIGLTELACLFGSLRLKIFTAYSFPQYLQNLTCSDSNPRDSVNGGFVSRCFVWVGVRIRVGIHNQQDMSLYNLSSLNNLGYRRWPQTQYERDSMRKVKNCQVRLPYFVVGDMYCQF